MNLHIVECNAVASQKFIKLTSYCDFCYIVTTILSHSFLFLGEFEKAGDLLDRSLKLIFRDDSDNKFHDDLESRAGEIFCNICSFC